MENLLKLENLEINKMKFFVNKNGNENYNLEINEFEKLVNLRNDFKNYNFRIYKKNDYIKLVISLKY